MRTIRNLMLVAFMTFSTLLIASAPEDSVFETVKLTSDIQKLMKNHDFDFTEEVKTEVLITLNKYDEIVVLSVDNCNEQVRNFIKSKLNYKKLTSDYKGSVRTFIVPITLVPES